LAHFWRVGWKRQDSVTRPTRKLWKQSCQEFYSAQKWVSAREF
jgi:hypothetical protein